MEQHDFQDEVIDRLARIETKQDTTNGRVSRLEDNVDSLKMDRAESRGANRIITGASGVLGTVIGAIAQYIWHR